MIEELLIVVETVAVEDPVWLIDGAAVDESKIEFDDIEMSTQGVTVGLEIETDESEFVIWWYVVVFERKSIVELDSLKNLFPLVDVVVRAGFVELTCIISVLDKAVLLE